jgi:hypothetical protein
MLRLLFLFMAVVVLCVGCTRDPAPRSNADNVVWPTTPGPDVTKLKLSAAGGGGGPAKPATSDKAEEPKDKKSEKTDPDKKESDKPADK